MPPRDWWTANVVGRARPYSDTLIAGLGDTLCILAIYGDILCSDRLGIDLQVRADRLVRALLTDLDAEQWLSRRRLLRVLAEASPCAFLDCLESELAKEAPAIESIMGTVDGGITGECLRTDLLWGLEVLAWEPSNLKRVCEILQDLCRFPADDNWVNKPFESLKSLFRPWLPMVTVNLERRVELLRHLMERDRRTGFDLCLALLPRGFGDTASENAKPRWRRYDTERSPVTNGEIWRMHEVARGLLIAASPHSTDEIAALIEHIEAFPAEELPLVTDAVKAWMHGDPSQSDIAKAQDAAREQWRLQKPRKTRGADGETSDETSPFEAALGELLQLLTPADLTERLRGQFSAPWVFWPEADEDSSHEVRQARVGKARARVIAEVQRELGLEGLVEFAVQMAEPGIVGATFVDSGADHATIADFTARLLKHPSRDAAVSALRGVFSRQPREGYRELLGAIEALGALDEDQCRRIAESMPGEPAAWTALRALGPGVEEHFWRNVRVYGFQLEGDDAEFAVDRLLEVGRPRTAFEAFAFEPERLRPRTWVRVLCGIVDVDEPNGPRLDLHSLERVFESLDSSEDLTTVEIARLEWPFVDAFWPSGQRQLALHRQMSCDPRFFVDLLRWAYKRSDGLEEPPPGEHAANNAWKLLRSWRCFPGLNDDGSIDEKEFWEWNNTVRRMAQEAARPQVADIVLGEAYGHAKPAPDGLWPPKPIRDLLEEPWAGELRSGFRTGVFNSRGITSRNPYEGGEQERALADRYDDLAASMAADYPRLAATIREISKDYRHLARSEDEQAILSERWHP